MAVSNVLIPYRELTGLKQVLALLSAPDLLYLFLGFAWLDQHLKLFYFTFCILTKAIIPVTDVLSDV